nr:beta-parvin-like [Loxodonta africana]
MSDLQEEGKNAINSSLSPALVDIHPEDTLLEENEERTMIDPTSKEDPKFKELVKDNHGLLLMDHSVQVSLVFCGAAVLSAGGPDR